MDHLEHREWIESANKGNPLWLGKSSYFRIPCLDDGELIQLAKENYELRQKVYQKELGELIRWSKICGLMDMGFAREKTTYCYFAVASATSLPYDSYVRLIVAKSAVLVTIFDDYFDMVGSLDELQILANAVKRWNIKGLKSHGKILFDALDSFVTEVANKYFDQYGIDIVDNLQKIKEVKDGKINSVHIYMKENPEANIEDAIHYVENLLEETKMKLLELALMDGNDVEDLPKPCKRLHLTALKVFQMFFNSANHFDSKDSLLNDINKAIFIPLEPHTSLHHSEPQPLLPPPKKPRLVINSYNKVSMKYHGPWKPNHRFHCTFPAISTGSRRMVPLMKVYSSKFNFFVTH
uniref:Terpene synthase metal-binding domain-containing protein n=1 Tax=Chenopodium quinoa TaxID=63459 RepID=A0A803LPR9_CHEQI